MTVAKCVVTCSLGIPYLNPTHEQTLRDNLKWRHQQAAQLSSPAFTTPDGQDPVIKGPITIPTEHEEFLSNTWWVGKIVTLCPI